MSLSDDERRALRGLEEQLDVDPAIEDALRSFRPRRDRRWVVMAAIALVAWTMSVIALLAVSLIASFAAFVVVLVAVWFLVRAVSLRCLLDEALIRIHSASPGPKQH